MSKTASGLVAYCKAQLGKPYWMGTYGNTATAALYLSNKKRLPAYYTAADFSSQYGQRVHDCVGLIKGYRWSETPTSAPRYNASQDVAVSGLLSQCSQKGAISTMPDQPGVCVFMDGHVGVYIGDGYVIEARGHAYGVVKTKLSGRGWTKWGKPDWLTYDTTSGTSSGVKPASGSTTTTKEDKKVTVTMRQLSKGSTGTAVRRLEVLLKDLGYYTGALDTIFGPLLDKAVRAYQNAVGLGVDGVVGALTWGKLLS